MNAHWLSAVRNTLRSADGSRTVMLRESALALTIAIELGCFELVSIDADIRLQARSDGNGR